MTSYLGVPLRKSPMLPGETKAEYKTRMEREWDLMIDRSRDPSLQGDRRVPVRYDE